MAIHIEIYMALTHSIQSVHPNPSISRWCSPDINPPTPRPIAITNIDSIYRTNYFTCAH